MSEHPIGYLSPDGPEMQRFVRVQQGRARAILDPNLGALSERVEVLRLMYPSVSPELYMAVAQLPLELNSPEITSMMEDATLQAFEEPELDGGGGPSLFGQIGNVVSGAVDEVGDLAKGTTRVAFTAAEGLFEEAETVVRGTYFGLGLGEDEGGLSTFWDVVANEGSAARLALGDLVTFDKVDLGEGFFAGGEIAESVRNLNTRYRMKNGDSFTTGRALATTVFDQDSLGYNLLSGTVDAAATIALDPATYLSGGLSHVQKINKTFDAVDAGRSGRLIAESFNRLRRLGPEDAGAWKWNTAHLDRVGRVEEWLGGAAARDVAEFVSETSSPTKIRQAFGNKITVDQAVMLADEGVDTVEGALQTIKAMALDPAGTMNAKLKLPSSNTFFGPTSDSAAVRAFRKKFAQATAFLPDRELTPFADGDVVGRTRALEQMNRLMLQADLDDAFKDRIFKQVHSGGSSKELFEVIVHDVVDEIGRKLVDEGVDRALLFDQQTGILRVYKEASSQANLYATSDLFDEIGDLGLKVDEGMRRVSSPFVAEQTAEGGIPLPDIGELRRVMRRTDKLAQATSPGGRSLVKAGTGFLETAMQSVWVPMTLLRAAWPVKIIAEEQLRMAMAGLDSAFSHPISYLSTIMDRKKMGLVERRLGTDIKGEVFIKDIVSNPNGKGYILEGNPEHVYTKWKDAQRAAERVVSQELSDAMAFDIAGVTDVRRRPKGYKVIGTQDVGFQAAWAEELVRLSNSNVVRRVLSDSTLEDTKRWFRTSTDRVEVGAGNRIADSDEAADQYVEMVARYMDERVGKSEELKDVLRRGSAVRSDEIRRDIHKVTTKMKDDLGDQIVDLENGIPGLPRQVVGEVLEPGTPANRFKSRYDEVVRTAFNGLMTKPTARLSRSPAFKQHYYSHVNEFFDLLDAKSRSQMLANLKKMGLDPKMEKDLLRRHAAMNARTPTDARMHRQDNYFRQDFDPNPSAETLRVERRAKELDRGVGKGWERVDREPIVGERGPDNIALGRRTDPVIAEWDAWPMPSGPGSDLERWRKGEIELAPPSPLDDGIVDAEIIPVEKGVEVRQAKGDDIAERGPGSSSEVARRPGGLEEDAIDGEVYDVRHRALGSGDGEVIDVDSYEVWGELGPGVNPEDLTISLDDLDAAAKAYALDETRSLLYDLANRRQFFEAHRLLFPFGEAWGEVLSSWAKLSVQNPQRLRRGSILVEGGLSEGTDLGVFQVDEETGETTFMAPVSAGLAAAFSGSRFGVDSPFEVRTPVDAFNVIGGVQPGFGPVVQLAVSQWLPETPDTDWVRGIVSPFGSTEAPWDTLPGWVDRLQTGGWIPEVFGLGGRSEEQERIFMGTVASVMQSLAMSGEYNIEPGNPQAAAEQARLLKDAKRDAKNMYLIRGIAQNISPAEFGRPEVFGRSGDGHLESVQSLTQLYYSYLDEDPETAVDRFLAELGPSAYLLMQGRTEGTYAVTDEIYDWVRENRDLSRKHRDVFAFFVPPGDPEADFNYDAYQAQIRSGDRITLSPEEMLEEANSRLGRHIMRQYREAMPNAAPGVFQEVERDLIDRLPGYNPREFSSDTLVTISKLEKAISDPALADHPLSKDLEVYFQAREIASRAARTRLGLNDWSQSDAAAPIRHDMRRVALKLMARNAGFAEVWSRVLSREFAGTEER